MATIATPQIENFEREPVILLVFPATYTRNIDTTLTVRSLICSGVALCTITDAAHLGITLHITGRKLIVLADKIGCVTDT